MTPVRWAVAVLLLAAAQAALAQPSHVGELFPLTGTRYGTSRGHAPVLMSNGRDPVVFWSDEQYVRVARFANGRFEMSRMVCQCGDFDVVWTGRHFLVVAGSDSGIVGRLVDWSGDPRGEPFAIAAGWQPRMAFNGRNALLLYVTASGLEALLLTADGKAAENAPRILGVVPEGRVAVASNGDSFAAIVPRIFEPRLFLFDARGAVTSRSIFGSNGTAAAITSDGRRYLGVAACQLYGLCMPPFARVIEPDGTASAPTELAFPYRTRPSVVWDGVSWVVGYMRDETQAEPPTLEVVLLDQEARAIRGRDERPAGEASLAVIGGRVLAAWVDARYRDTIVVGGLPLESSTATPASFTAKQQVLPVTAASAIGTLIVWQERGGGRTTLHTGVRAPDGRWTEQEIHSVAPRDCYVCYEETINVIAASDGREFIVYTEDTRERVIRRLDVEGKPVGQPVPAPSHFSISQILWSGHDYLLISGAGRSLIRMTPSGAFTGTVTLPSMVSTSATFGTDGEGRLLAVWLEWVIVNHERRIESLSAVRLDGDLQPVDAAPLKLATKDLWPSPVSIGWDGRQYVVVWSGAAGVMAAQVPLSGEPRVRGITGERGDYTSVAAVPGGAAILWKQVRAQNRVTFLRHDGSITEPVTVSDSDDRGYDSGEIVPLPDGGLAHVEAAVQHGPPFESTSRILMRILSTVPLPPQPDAPRLAARYVSPREIALTWSPRTAAGHRVEYRLDSGPWIEHAITFSSAMRFTPEPGGRYTFRVRAWNEAGAGPYSNAVVASPTRRRTIH